MKKKVRVDFSAHIYIVVAVEDGDDYLDRASNLAKEYVVDNQSLRTVWELDDGGVDDANEEDDVDVTE